MTFTYNATALKGPFTQHVVCQLLYYYYQYSHSKKKKNHCLLCRAFFLLSKPATFFHSRNSLTFYNWNYSNVFLWDKVFYLAHVRFLNQDRPLIQYILFSCCGGPLDGFNNLMVKSAMNILCHGHFFSNRRVVLSSQHVSSHWPENYEGLALTSKKPIKEQGRPNWEGWMALKFRLQWSIRWINWNQKL